MGTQMQQLTAFGQSIWLDNIRRSMFASGELQKLIDQGLRGMTSNPTIFEKAIGAGSDYDEQLRSLIGDDSDATALFEALAIRDIRSACDAFAAVYRVDATARRLRLARSVADPCSRYARYDRCRRAASGRPSTART